MNCYRHPKVETTLRCSRCEKYICPDCAVLTPVGYRCKDCGKERSATQALGGKHLGLGIVLGFGIPFASGYLALKLPIFVFLLFLAAIVGSAVGRLLRKVIGMKRSQLVAVIAAVGYFAGVSVEPISTALRLGELDATTLLSANLWTLLYAAIASACTMVQLK